MAETNWITQQELAKELSTPEKKITVQVINNWIRRGKIKAKIEPKYGIRLVDKTSILTKKA